MLKVTVPFTVLGKGKNKAKPLGQYATLSSFLKNPHPDLDGAFLISISRFVPIEDLTIILFDLRLILDFYQQF